MLTTGDVASHYDELDPFYLRLWGEHLHHGLWLTGAESSEQAVRQLLDAVISEAGISSGSDVCDIGCGYGASARFLAEELGCRVTGYTISGAQHAQAIRLAPERGELRILLQDWLEGDGPNQRFDTLIAIESTEHMVDKEVLFRRAFQALRLGGRMVVCAWVAASIPRTWEVELLLRPICKQGQLAGLASEEEYLGWIRDAGFSDLRLTDLSYQVRKTWSICSGRVARFLLRPSVWKWFAKCQGQNRGFVLAIPRIWIAYRTGALRYLLFSAKRNGTQGQLRMR